MAGSNPFENKSGFLRQFLRKAPGVPTKPKPVKVETLPPPLEIHPNYIRRAMGIRGRRVIISPEAQTMMRLAAVYQTMQEREQSGKVVSGVVGTLHAHQLDAMDRLRGLGAIQPIVLDSYPWGK